MTVRHNYLIICAIAIISMFSLLVINNNTAIFDLSAVHHIPHWYKKHFYVSSDDSFTIKTIGCTIPGMKPLSDDVKKYVEYPNDMIPCPHANRSIIDNNRTHIWIVHKNIDYYNVTNIKEFICCYIYFYRSDSVTSVNAGNIDDRAEYSDCTNFTDIIEVKHEFVRVTCTENETIIYDNYYIFAPFKEIKLFGDNKEIPKNKSAYNVIILGIDAVSRLNFHRTMPKTLAFIKEKDGTELIGYNKVADNSFPNLVPLLMGYTADEVKKICHPFRHSTFDFCPFIWHWYKEAGYYTAFAEDCSYLGTFNYVLDGFIRSPTDYYAHTFMHQAEKQVGHIQPWNTQLCMNDKYFYNVLLDYIENISITLQYHKLFAFFWETTMSHDYLNYPMVMDDSYERFFKRLDESKYLDDSIIILMSDHGIRWGGIRSTKQGYFEERLPFVYILTPPSFRENYTEAYKNLKSNSRRLTTPFNVHATLHDLINLDNIKDEKIILRSEENYHKNRSISLFLPIPLNRTCKDAAIDDHWCACHVGTKIDKDNKDVMSAADYMVNTLNSLLSNQPECAQLSVKEIVDATEMHVMSDVKWEDEEGWREYLVTVRTAPSDGLFEGTIRFHNGNWTLSGTVSRLNLYGDQSRCIHNAHLKLYCYCKE